MLADPLLHLAAGEADVELAVGAAQDVERGAVRRSVRGEREGCELVVRDAAARLLTMRAAEAAVLCVGKPGDIRRIPGPRARHVRVDRPLIQDSPASPFTPTPSPSPPKSNPRVAAHRSAARRRGTARRRRCGGSRGARTRR